MPHNPTGIFQEYSPGWSGDADNNGNDDDDSGGGGEDNDNN